MTNPRFKSLRFFIALLVGALCYPVTMFVNGASVGAQSVGGSTVDIQYFLGFAVAIERGIEAFKRGLLVRLLPDTEKPDGTIVDRSILRRDIAFVLSLIVGLIVAWVFSLNMFAGLGAAYVVPGTLLTGLIVGGGSNMVHKAFEIAAKVKELLSARVDVATSQAQLYRPDPIPERG